MTGEPKPLDAQSTKALEARLAELRAKIDAERRATGFIDPKDLDEAVDLIEELDRRFMAEEAECRRLIHSLSATSGRLEAIKTKLEDR